MNVFFSNILHFLEILFMQYLLIDQFIFKNIKMFSICVLKFSISWNGFQMSKRKDLKCMYLVCYPILWIMQKLEDIGKLIALLVKICMIYYLQVILTYFYLNLLIVLISLSNFELISDSFLLKEFILNFVYKFNISNTEYCGFF